MKVLLYIKKGEQPFGHVATATTDQGLDNMMQYVRYKVSYGYDIKIEHEKEV